MFQIFKLVNMTRFLAGQIKNIVSITNLNLLFIYNDKLSKSLYQSRSLKQKKEYFVSSYIIDIIFSAKKFHCNVIKHRHRQKSGTGTSLV